MTIDWSDKRREFRFLLKGSLEHFQFAFGNRRVSVEPIDVSRSGIGLLMEEAAGAADEIQIVFADNRPPVTLHVRFRGGPTGEQNHRARYGLELSDKDKRRGVDLISLLNGVKGLRLVAG